MSGGRSVSGAVATIYVPTALFATAVGALSPMIASIASERGASLAVAGLLSGSIVIGEVMADLPVARLVERLGERRVLAIAAAFSFAAAAACLVSPSLIVLAIGLLGLGAGSAAFALARHAYLTVTVPYERRARMMSLLAGTTRMGTVVGPLLAAMVIGSGRSASPVLGLVIAVLGFTTLVLMFGAGRERGGAGRPRMAVRPADGLRSLSSHRRTLATAGLGVGVLGMLRAGRQILLPLWAVASGIDAAYVALVLGVTGAVELLLFGVSGWVMDRHGRMSVIVPCMAALSAVHLVLAFAPLTGESWFLAIAVMMMLANAGAAGVMMTVGADLAPPDRPAPFLSAWRFVSDVCAGATPVVVSVVVALATVPAAAGVLGAIGCAGSVLIVRTLPRALREAPGARERSGRI